MATEIIQFNDPFNPDDQTIVQVEPGLSAYTVLATISYDPEIYDIVVSRNNEIIDCDFVIDDNDIVMFALVPKGGGGGKSILATVALIAIAVAAPYAAGYAVGLSSAGMVGASIGSVYAMGGLGAAMIYGGVMVGTMVLGGMLVNSLFKPDVPPAGSGLQNFEQSPTYGWSVAGNTIQQGGVIPVLYGEMKIAPQIIEKQLRSIDNKQYLGLLMALGEGVIDEISDVKINDDPIGNYTSVQMDIRTGTNNQTMIPLWGDTWSDVGVNKALINATTWVEGRTSGDSVEKLDIGVVAPTGIFYANDAGGLSSYTVKLSIEYREIGGAWISLFGGAQVYPNVRYIYVDKTPTKPSNSTLYYPDQEGPFDKYKIIGVDLWNADVSIVEYVGEVASLPTGIAISTMTWNGQIVWTHTSAESVTPYYTLTEKTNSPIRRTISLVGLNPHQYEVRMRYYEVPQSGTRYGSDVSFEFLQEGVTDDFRYPNTALLSVNILATDQLSGGAPRITTVVKRTSGTYGPLDNPAWACLDLLLNTRYGAGIPLTRINLDSFTSWAEYCISENLKVNLYLDQNLSLAESLNMIGALGRGSVVQYGSDFVALVDRPNIAPVQGFLFSMGNIIQNSFNESFLPLKDRANIIEVTYYDKDEDYQRTSVELSQGNYDLISTVNKTSLNLIGCVSRDQAIKQAKYHLNQNRYLTITASWEASIDAIHCRVGDVVNVAHDVPQWGYSGRIISASGATVELDRVDLGSWDSAKQYYIQISNSLTDTQLYHRVLSVNNGVLTLQTALTETVGEYSVYSFGEVNRHAKQMRILSISTSGELKRRINAIEYNSNVYSDTASILTPVYVPDLGVSNLKATDYLAQKSDGTIETVVNLSWNGASIGYNVSYIEKVTGATLVSIGAVRETYVDIRGLKDEATYIFKVDEATLTYTVQGKTTAPDDVAGISGTESGNVFTILWDYPFFPLDFKEFEIYYLGTKIGTTTAKRYTTAKIEGITGATFTIKAKDTTGNISSGQSVTIPVAVIPSVTSVTGTAINGKLSMSWTNLQKPTDFSHYEIRYNSTLVGSSTVESFEGALLTHSFVTAVYSVYVIDTAGNASLPANTSVSVSAPVISNITQSFSLNDLTLNWTVSNGAYSIKSYTVTGVNGGYSTAVPAITIPVNWLGSRVLTITGTDAANNTFSATVTVTISAPSTPSVLASVSATTGIEFSWTTTAGTTGISEYLLTYNGNQVVTKDTFYFVPTVTQGSYVLSVVAKDYAGNLSSAGSKTVAISAPSVQNISAITLGQSLTLKWESTAGVFNIKDYKVEYTNGGGILVSVFATMKEYTLTPDWAGAKTFTITPRDLAGNYGTAVQFSHTVVAPSAPTVQATVTGKDLVLKVTQSKGSFDLGPVEIAWDTTVVTANNGTPDWTIPIFWDQLKTFSVTSVDLRGNRSTATQVQVNILEGSINSLAAEVIDNNVLLKWGSVEGTLPIDYYRVSKGSTYASSVEVGTAKATFATLFESDAGTYTYWITPIDTAGNQGQYSGLVVSVAQPPDFILNVEWDSNWSGTKTNIKVEGTKGILPVNLTETYQAHFTTRSWTTVQAQVTAGYPRWLTPSTGSASYVQTFDYGVLLGSTNVTLTDPLMTKFGDGTYTMSRRISVSADNVTFIDQPLNAMQVFVTNIRYVKVTYTFTVSTNTLLEVGNFHLRLDSKIKNDSGSGYANAGDAGGTTVNFNIPFVDITSISVTPQGTTPVIAIYDFADVPNPTSFKVLLYNTAGTRVSGNFSWSARGY